MMTKFEKFKALHHQEEAFLLPNVWDAGGAYLVETMGFQAVATTSAGIAFSNGLPDGSFTDANLVFETLEKIVTCVDLPVTADIESGYGDIIGNIKKLKEIGIVGANIEDAVGRERGDLMSFDEAVAAIKEAKQAAGSDFILNARTDTYLTGQADALGQSIERGNAFVEAGADCVFIPGVKTEEEIKTLVAEIPAPINIVAGLSDKPLTVAQYQACGVKRISTGGSLMRRAFAAFESSLKEIRDSGTFGFAGQAISDDAINELFKNRLNKG